MDVARIATPVRLWTRAELRRRWLALVLLGVLAGLAAGLAMAAVDGASRAESSYRRMRAQQLAADVVWFPSQVGLNDADVTKLAELPEVAAWAGFANMPASIDGLPPDAGPFVPIGSDWFTRIERAKVLQGRLPDPDRDDEAVVNEPALVALKQYGLQVGSVLTMRTLSLAESASFGPDGVPDDFDWTKAHGPVTNLRIVGAVRLPAESVVSFASGPLLLPSPGWARDHLAVAGAQPSASVVPDFVNAMVRLRNGPAGVPAFEADLARIYGRDDLPVKDLADDIKRVQESLDVERAAVLVFAGAVVLAALVVVGQALTRSLRAGAEPVTSLRAMGLSRGGIVAGLVAPHALTLAVAIVTAAATAVGLSVIFPVGLAHRLDPDLGIQVNGSVLAVGLLVLALVFAASCCGLGWWMARRLVASRVTRRTQFVGAATRAGAPVPAAVGASLALEATQTRTGPRAALVAAAVGVAGVVGAVTLVGGIDGMLRHPERAGQTWDLEAYPAPSLSAATTTLGGEHDVAAFALRSRMPTVVDGLSVPLYSLHSYQGSISFVPLAGRAPSGDDEIALGPRTAASLHARIGSTVTAGPAAVKLRVVGITLLAQTAHGSYDEGGWLTPTGLDRASGTVCCTGLREDQMVIKIRDGASAAAVSGTLGSQGIDAEVPAQPPDVTNLGDIRELPVLLAAFLVLLAVGAVAHALLTGVRSRQHDLAVLRALGLTPRQAWACVTWQAGVIGMVGLAVGIPLGLVVGSQVWRLLTTSLSFVYVGPVAWLGLALLVPAVFAVVVLLSLWPARGAARLRPAEVLRSE